MNITLPNESTANWGVVYNTAITTLKEAIMSLQESATDVQQLSNAVTALQDQVNQIEAVSPDDLEAINTAINDAINDLNSALGDKASVSVVSQMGLALQQQISNSINSLQSLINGVSDALNVHKNEYESHRHNVTDIDGLAQGISDLNELTPTMSVSGLETSSSHVSVHCFLGGSTDYVYWTAETIWGNNVASNKMTNLSSVFSFAKLPADSSVWINNKANLKIKIKAKSPGGGLPSKWLEQTVEVSRYNHISVGELANMLAANSSFIEAVGGKVAHQAVIEAFYKNQES